MGARSRSLALAGELSSVPAGRHFVRDLLLEWGLAAAVDDASLAVTELVANSVKHARSSVQIAVTVDTDILVEVRDRSALLRRRRSEPEPLAENGRGLRIVAAVSRDWGCTAEPTGKCLWFRLPLPDAGRADADVIALHAGPARGAGSHAQLAVDTGSGSAQAGSGPVSGRGTRLAARSSRSGLRPSRHRTAS